MNRLLIGLGIAALLVLGLFASCSIAADDTVTSLPVPSTGVPVVEATTQAPAADNSPPEVVELG